MPMRRCASRAKSTIMMPFFFTSPISSTMPITATRSSGRPERCSASSAPTVADGSVDRMVTGWITLS